jgi:divalent metal cation (Fe/Co/Zn/Cd) transporter
MSVASAPVPAGLSTAKRLEGATVAWNTVEAAVALGSGLLAGSVALTGFGLDSGIEVASALLVLNRVRAAASGKEPDEVLEKKALRAVAALFFVLATYLVADGIHSLVAGDRPNTSVSGIVVAAAALVVMPLLSAAKTRVSRRIGGSIGSLVLADAAETKLCALLAVATLVGLIAYSAAGWWWADPIAGFVIVYFAIREGRGAWDGDLCCD